MADPLVTLHRPVGPKELELIAASGYRAFPPRLPEQPIFYPVLNEEYAIQGPRFEPSLVAFRCRRPALQDHWHWPDGVGPPAVA
jgi:hypothetical protein